MKKEQGAGGAGGLKKIKHTQVHRERMEGEGRKGEQQQQQREKGGGGERKTRCLVVGYNGVVVVVVVVPRAARRRETHFIFMQLLISLSRSLPLPPPTHPPPARAPEEVVEKPVAGRGHGRVTSLSKNGRCRRRDLSSQYTWAPEGER